MTQETRNKIDNNKLSLSKAMTEAVLNHSRLLQENYNQRREYLLQRIKDLNDRDENSRITLVQLLNREQTRADFSYLRKVFKPSRSKGITTIEVPDPDHEGQFIQINEPNSMQEYLYNRNIRHFSQAELTPFTTSPLIDLLQYNGTNEESRRILEGDLDRIQLDELSEATKQILQMLGEQRNIPKIPKDISFEEYLKAFEKWRERTTTSPCGRHLGHYKVLLKLNILDEEDNNINISRTILKLYYQITIIAVRLGCTLDRWSVVSTCMIEKIIGNPRIDKLRVIHLFEADYNLILKLIWSRRAVWQAHCCNVLNHGQSGSRPGRRAIDVVIMKEMKYQYARFTKTNLGTIDNDAKSCYDRIICNVAMLISQYYGIPTEFCNMQAETLRKTKFYIRTALGESKYYYSHSTETPIHGTGQGSCASPAIWLLISSFIMDALERQANGMTMEDITITADTVIEWINGFVDDTSIFTNNNYENQNLTQLKRRLEYDGNKWANLLQATGGKLELNKCFFYLLTWKCDVNGKATPQTIQEQIQQDNTPITIKDIDGTFVNLKQIEVNKSHKTLGVYKCIHGEEIDHLRVLAGKNKEFIRKAWNGQINRRMARRAFNSHYVPSILYSLAATNIMEDDINNIQQNATTTFIRIQGYDMTFPRAVIYGPKNFGGIGILKVSVENN
jgi:Reverse transcriptase (RNA-dependent DNA polymerase)